MSETQHHAHVKTRDAVMTAVLAHDVIGTASMQSPDTLAAELGFGLDTSVFDEIAFTCECCDWFCSMDENNEGLGGRWLCDDCAHDESGGD